MTETLEGVLEVGGPYLENGSLVVIEAASFSQLTQGSTHDWLVRSSQPGFTGTGYLHNWPDIDTLYEPTDLASSPVVSYPINFSTPGTYTIWVRAYANSAPSDSLYVGLAGDRVTVTGFDPGMWDWANEVTPNGAAATLVVESSGLHTLSLLMREDGLQVDRVLLTTDTNYIPTDFGPAESEREPGTNLIPFPVDRVIEYDYDPLYRLVEANYSTGELYEYDYDPVGNRLQQIINGDTTEYLYDAANRLEAVDGQSYTFDANGNLLATGVMTNSWDAGNRLVETSRGAATLEPIYNGIGDRVGQIVDGVTTDYALDIQGLPEVIQTSDENSYLHLPGVIMAENTAGETRYLLSDGLGSIRQVVDEMGEVVDYNEYDPYGNPVTDYVSRITPYGYTGEWWEDDLGLLYLRARWYLPQDGVFLSRDPVESEPPYLYGGGNPINLIDPSGMVPPPPAARPSNYKIYYSGVRFWQWIYDKRNPIWNCAGGDDGQHPSDTFYDFMRDFVCEWGEKTTRKFRQNDHLTMQLRKSSGILQIRQNFFNRLTFLGLRPGNTVSGSRQFSYREFIGATIEIPRVSLLTHMLGSYSYDIHYEAYGTIRFEVTNPINRQSGSRIPGVYEGPAAEEILDNPQFVPSVQSYLALKTRQETIDPEGGGAMIMKFTWRESFVDLCGVVPPIFSP